jgi:hypothetical protein
VKPKPGRVWNVALAEGPAEKSCAQAVRARRMSIERSSATNLLSNRAPSSLWLSVVVFAP